MQKGIALLVGTEIPSKLIFKPIAHIAGNGLRLYALDGDNSFRSYQISRYARELGLNPRNALNNVLVARAFTCYQMADLISRLRQHTMADSVGIVCLGMLYMFYDEDVSLPDARRLLRNVIQDLKALAQTAAILITVRPPPRKMTARLEFVNELMSQADWVRILHPVAQNAFPMPLWLEGDNFHGTHE
jgi:Rad51 protein